MFKFFRSLVFFITLSSIPFHVRSQVLTDSNLPIVIIHTDEEIIDEPKRNGTMKIIYRGPGQRNAVVDQNTAGFLNYNGNIAIEIRGSSSQLAGKKSYGFETRKANMTDKNNVVLMGMPSENDWILNSLAFDPSLLHDFLAYRLSQDLGNYATRGVYCEVLINDDYKGLYILQEKIKEDGNRVNIEEITTSDNTSPNVTGGYITKADKTTGGDPVAFTMDSEIETVQFIHDTPDPDVITTAQGAYIETVFRALESQAGANNASLVNGFPSIIDIPSFIDYMLVNEYGSCVDAYQFSTYFHKDRNGKLRAGPVWDFNYGFGMDFGFHGGRSVTDQWQFNNVDNVGPRFFKQLFNNPVYRCYIAKRWNELIQPGQPFNETRVHGFIDDMVTTLTESAARENTRWSTIGDFISERDQLKTFISQRIAWISANINPSSSCSFPTLPSLVINEIMYNPPGSTENEEFIEIKNAGAATVDLTGIYFSGLGLVYQFPVGSSLAAGGLLVISSNSAGYQTQYGHASFGEYTRKLSNSTQKLVLADAFGSVIDMVEYFDSAPWPTEADGGGKSLELKNPSLDNNVAENWFVRATDFGSPGQDNNGALPVTLVSFKAMAETHAVVLSWEVADEVDMDKYTVERSPDGRQFLPVGEIQAAKYPSYSLTDHNPASGNNYYRLKMSEIGGQSAFSSVVKAYVAQGAELVFYPNPTAGLLSMKMKPEMINRAALIYIMDMTGKEIGMKKTAALRETELLDLSKVVQGKYLIRIENDQESTIGSVDVIR